MSKKRRKAIIRQLNKYTAELISSCEDEIRMLEAEVNDAFDRGKEAGMYKARLEIERLRNSVSLWKSKAKSRLEEINSLKRCKKAKTDNGTTGLPEINCDVLDGYVYTGKLPNGGHHTEIPVDARSIKNGELAIAPFRAYQDLFAISAGFMAGTEIELSADYRLRLDMMPALYHYIKAVEDGNSSIELTLAQFFAPNKPQRERAIKAIEDAQLNVGEWHSFDTKLSMERMADKVFQFILDMRFYIVDHIFYEEQALIDQAWNSGDIFKLFNVQPVHTLDEFQEIIYCGDKYIYYRSGDKKYELHKYEEDGTTSYCRTIESNSEQKEIINPSEL